MKLSAQEEYGLRCLVALANAHDKGGLTIVEISKAEGLTPSHVAKLMAILRRHDLVTSTRGQLGGYALSRPAAQIGLLQVLECLGGRIYNEGFCERHAGLLGECVHESECILRPLWNNIQAAVDSVLSRYSLADLVSGTIGEPLIQLSGASRG